MRRLVVSVVVGLVALAGAVWASSGAAAAPTVTGLVLSYQFEADTGQRVRDSGPNAINGTYVNTTAAEARVAGAAQRGNAIELVGTDHEYLAVPERNALDVNRFTLAALVRYTGVENDQTLGRWEVMEKAGAYWMNVRTDGKVRVGGFFGGCTSKSWKYLDSNIAVPLDTWTHLAATYNGSKLTVWINGKAAGGLAVSGATCANNLPLAIGAKHNPDKGLLEAFWDGRLDDVRIYRRALTASEIAGLVAG